jgi:proline dehydrogenase
MLREAMLVVAQQGNVKQFVMYHPLGQVMARRFVAGEKLDEAIEVTRRLNDRGISVSLDHLGENVSDACEARASADDYVTILERIHAEGVEANISIKLTALGLDVDADLCRENVRRVLCCARQHAIFVRVDMEASAYTQRTLDLVSELRGEFDNVGTVLQTALYRTSYDVEALIQTRTRVRLVKGAYLEPPKIAYSRKADVDAAYVQQMHELLDRGVYPAIATHNTRIIDDARAYADAHHIPRARFEFQMLYGIRRDLQEQLTDAGYNVRVYVPYGTQWYPYLTRRMVERPANLVFVASNMLRR